MDIERKLTFFKKILTDFLGNNLVEYTADGQVIQKNLKSPWVQLEILSCELAHAVEEYENSEVSELLVPVSKIQNNIFLKVHVRSVHINSYEALETGIFLQTLFNDSRFVSGLRQGDLVVSLPGETIDATISTLQCNVIVFDNRVEADYWFPITLSFTHKFELRQISGDWFNAVLMSMEIKEEDESLNLDNERME